jgi:hypothetical protein
MFRIPQKIVSLLTVSICWLGTFSGFASAKP